MGILPIFIYAKKTSAVKNQTIFLPHFYYSNQRLLLTARQFHGKPFLH